MIIQLYIKYTQKIVQIEYNNFKAGISLALYNGEDIMNKTRQELIERLKYSNQKVIEDIKSNKFLFSQYTVLASVYPKNKREQNEIEKMIDEMILVDVGIDKYPNYVLTKKGKIILK